MKKDAGPPPRELNEDLGESKATIERPSSADDSTPVAIENFSPLSSYNIITGTNGAHILVPGWSSSPHRSRSTSLTSLLPSLRPREHNSTLIR